MVRFLREVVDLEDDENIKWGRHYRFDNHLNHSTYSSGVYEFSVRPGEGAPLVPVYIGGATCLHERHSAYLGSKNHKKSQFEEAKRNGWDILVRVIKTKTVKEAFLLESRFLAAFDFAWNDKENGKVRSTASAIENFTKAGKHKPKFQLPAPTAGAIKKMLRYHGYEEKNVDKVQRRAAKEKALGTRVGADAPQNVPKPAPEANSGKKETATRKPIARRNMKGRVPSTK